MPTFQIRLTLEKSNTLCPGYTKIQPVLPVIFNVTFLALNALISQFNVSFQRKCGENLINNMLYFREHLLYHWILNNILITIIVDSLLLVTLNWYDPKLINSCSLFMRYMWSLTLNAIMIPIAGKYSTF